MPFPSKKNDIICLKEIIQIGRLFYENINILDYLAFLFTIVYNSYIFICLIKENGDLELSQLTFLDLEFLCLMVSSSLIKYDEENIYKKQNYGLLNIYYLVISVEIILIKIIDIWYFKKHHVDDDFLSITEKNQTFVSNFFVLCSEYILSIILTFNLASFYKKISLKIEFLFSFPL